MTLVGGRKLMHTSSTITAGQVLSLASALAEPMMFGRTSSGTEQADSILTPVAQILDAAENDGFAEHFLIAHASRMVVGNG
jgi:hypothetical protein